MKEVFMCFLVLWVSGLSASSRHPLSKGLGLLVLSVMVGGLIGVFFSSWLGLLLVLVYAGGMLVMFCYVCCLASMCLFSSSSVVVLSMVVLSVAMSSWLGWANVVGVESLWVEGHESMSACVSSSYLGVVLLFGALLCLVLSGVCKMVFIEDGPLRPF